MANRPGSARSAAPPPSRPGLGGPGALAGGLARADRPRL